MTLSYSVAMPNKSMATSGKVDLCSKCWTKKSETCSVPADYLSKMDTIDQASRWTTLTPNARK